MASKRTDGRSIKVFMSDGTVKVVKGIPGDAKITFGRVNPSDQRWNGNDYCLRIYTSRENQLAVFTGVAEFRDLALTVERQVVNTESEVSVTETAKGI